MINTTPAITKQPFELIKPIDKHDVAVLRNYSSSVKDQEEIPLVQSYIGRLNKILKGVAEIKPIMSENGRNISLIEFVSKNFSVAQVDHILAALTDNKLRYMHSEAYVPHNYLMIKNDKDKMPDLHIVDKPKKKLKDALAEVALNITETSALNGHAKPQIDTIKKVLKAMSGKKVQAVV